MSHFILLVCLIPNLISVVAAGGQLPAGVKPDDVKVTVLYVPPNCGSSRKAKYGDVLTTDYVGYFPNGKKFDSTWDRGQPMRYNLGSEEVIKGAEMASVGMCVGERRNSIIPPKLAYGFVDYAQIPAGSTLVFDTVLTKIEDSDNTAKLAEMGLNYNADGSLPLFSRKKREAEENLKEKRYAEKVPFKRDLWSRKLEK